MKLKLWKLVQYVSLFLSLTWCLLIRLFPQLRMEILLLATNVVSLLATPEVPTSLPRSNTTLAGTKSIAQIFSCTTLKIHRGFNICHKMTFASNPFLIITPPNLHQRLYKYSLFNSVLILSCYNGNVDNYLRYIHCWLPFYNLCHL